MPTYRLQTSLIDKSGLPKDQYVTTMYVASPTALGAGPLAAIAAYPSRFFSTIGQYLSPTIDQQGHTTKMYLLNAPLGTPPQFVYQWALTGPTTGQAFPSEVASCLTYHGSPQPGVRRQSWRGRMYIGPLNTASNQSGTPADTRPSLAFRTAVVDAAIIMADQLSTNESVKMVVASKVLQTVFPVATMSMDDAWDTQRSRGNRPTGRYLQAVPGGGGSSGPW